MYRRFLATVAALVVGYDVHNHFYDYAVLVFSFYIFFSLEELIEKKN